MRAVAYEYFIRGLRLFYNPKTLQKCKKNVRKIDVTFQKNTLYLR